MKRALITSVIIALVTSLNVHADGVDVRLLNAVRDNDIVQVQYMLIHGARVDATNEEGNTPLMIAAAYGYPELARTLIENGADVNARSRIGNTALIYATQEGQTDVVQLLVDYDADLQARNHYGSTPQKLATGWGHRDIVQILKEEQIPQRPTFAGVAGQVAAFLIGLIAIVAVPALTVGAVHASTSTTHSPLAR